MTLPLWPAPHVHFATIDTDILILDVARDRYDCLMDCVPWLTTDEDGRLLVGDTEKAEALIDMGVASPSDSGAALGRGIDRWAGIEPGQFEEAALLEDGRGRRLSNKGPGERAPRAVRPAGGA
ncbi:hypothetical protein [Brevundimonas sp.]|uniref:hypothetical protein n=1 Tax=Brevundimonas sp. TaxID=1871086 RepID=UPI00289FC834|nr:hypothetical protein [Brevundimonas sp.]